MPNIVLVGFMGTGKTSVGQRLAERLEMSYIDTDDVIEQDSGMIIADIFRQHGETRFRDLESAAVRKVSDLNNYVISTGGGVVLRETNLQMLKGNGIVFCLAATSTEIWKRVGHETHRPLLQTPYPLAKIQQMLTDRAPYYALADNTIQTTGLSIEQVTEQVIEEFEYAIRTR
jgi:shikimate kinase